MLKKLILISGALAILAGLTATVSAQQLYVSDIDVKFSTVAPPGSDTPSSGYCNDVSSESISVSFDTSGGNVWKNSSLIEFEQPRSTYPGACLGLCVQIVC
ncbi:MAG: hypothetical protein AAB359_03890, partial [Elusimicrobiota bacterium]